MCLFHISWKTIYGRKLQKLAGEFFYPSDRIENMLGSDRIESRPFVSFQALRHTLQNPQPSTILILRITPISEQKKGFNYTLPL